MKEYDISILTPTKNRIKLLQRLYESLLQQASFSSFHIQWLVGNDSSTDGTEDWLKSIHGNGHLDVQSMQLNGGGKHRSINVLSRLASGKYLAIVIVAREDLFITTKLFVNNVFNQELAAKAIDKSLTKLDLAYIDLVLLHQPYGDTFGAWRALANAQADGRIKSIGISNFDSAQMIEFTRMNDMKITPQVNQIEINPWNQRQADLAWHEKYQVQAEA